MRRLRSVWISSFAAMWLAACGGGGGSSNPPSSTPATTAPSQAISVNFGPTGQYVNGIFTSVQVCTPGTSSCQTIDNVLVDTGSYGLRILGTALTATLPAQTNGNSEPIGECGLFADGFTWGPVVTADVYLGGQKASNLAVNVIGQSNFPSAPSACSSGAGQEEDTVAQLLANGILGVGVFAQDCGDGCTQLNDSTPSVYFACTSTSVCTVTAESLVDQVTNPVALLASSNNGIIIHLPAINTSGAATVSGTMTFGIGTASNNSLGNAKVFTLDGEGEFSTTYEGTAYPASIVDSGSNALYFPSTIPTCSDDPGFYCPSSTLSQSAVMTGENSKTETVDFSVANTDTLGDTGHAAFDDLAGTTGDIGSGLNGTFDWGLPFFFGRNVYFAIDGETTPGGEGPYFAF